jgi:hypothetical protein
VEDANWVDSDTLLSSPRGKVLMEGYEIVQLMGCTDQEQQHVEQQFQLLQDNAWRYHLAVGSEMVLDFKRHTGEALYDNIVEVDSGWGGSDSGGGSGAYGERDLSRTVDSSGALEREERGQEQPELHPPLEQHPLEPPPQMPMSPTSWLFSNQQGRSLVAVVVELGMQAGANGLPGAGEEYDTGNLFGDEGVLLEFGGDDWRARQWFHYHDKRLSLDPGARA